jgi:hypothetical protein
MCLQSFIITDTVGATQAGKQIQNCAATINDHVNERLTN